MIRRILIGASKLAAAVVVVAGLTGAATGCDEEGYYGAYGLNQSAGYYNGYSAHDQVETTLGNFVDYGDGVAWTIEP